MTDKPDEIDELKNILFDLHDLLDSYSDLEYRANYMQELLPRLKQATLTLKKQWEINILKRVASVHCGIPTKTLKRADLKDWLVYEINQLNGDK